MIGIVGEIPGSGGIGDRHRLIEEIQRLCYCRSCSVAVTVAGLPARRIVCIARHQRCAVGLPCPGTGQKLPITVVSVGHRTVVRIGLGDHLATAVVAPACLLRSVGILESRHHRLIAQTVIGVFHRISRSVDPPNFAGRVVGCIGDDIARRRHLRLTAHIIVFKACCLAVDRLSQNRTVGVIGHRCGVNRGCSERFHQLNYPVKLIVGISDEIAVGLIRIHLLNGRRLIILCIGDDFGSIRIGYGLTSHTVAEPFQLRVGCLPAEVGTPAFQPVNTLLID